MSNLPYSLAILWRDRSRYLPAVLAVMFSAVLIAVQCGMLMAMVLCSSAPIDNAPAQIWVTTRDAQGLSLAYAIPDSWLLRLAKQPEIDRVEPYLLGLGIWHKKNMGSTDTCILIGSQMTPDSLGLVTPMPPEVRARLAETGTVVVDEQDLDMLNLPKEGEEVAEINDHQVRVVGTVAGFRGHNFLYIFCSLETVRTLVPLYERRPNLIMFALGRCREPDQVPVVVERLRQEYPDMGVYTGAEFSSRIRVYWLFRSRGGTVMLATVALALLVGLVVTSQTLYAASIASLREYAVLDALGIPRKRLVGLVLAKSFWIGIVGVVLAAPVTYFLKWAATLVETQVYLPYWLLSSTCLLTLGMALVSGLWALRSLRGVEPAILLH